MGDETLSLTFVLLLTLHSMLQTRIAPTRTDANYTHTHIHTYTYIYKGYTHMRIYGLHIAYSTERKVGGNRLFPDSFKHHNVPSPATPTLKATTPTGPNNLKQM